MYSTLKPDWVNRAPPEVELAGMVMPSVSKSSRVGENKHAYSLREPGRLRISTGGNVSAGSNPNTRA